MVSHEINEASELIREQIDSDANIIFGAGLDDSLKDEIKITVIGTGFDNRKIVSSNDKAKRSDSDKNDGGFVIPDFLK